MIRSITAKIGACACALALAMGVLAGCTGQASSALNDEAQQNRAYMSQVNGVMEQLKSDLESFIDAVSRGDVVNMRTQADNAYKNLDELSSIEAPELFSDIQKDYQDGTSKLREALDAYIALYTDIESASFDWSSYGDRIAQVQSLYDEGIKLLQQADEAAASLESSEG